MKTNFYDGKSNFDKLSKITSLFLLVIGFGLIINSCTKDLGSTVDNSQGLNKKLNERSASLGNYSVVNGRLYFPTFDDYYQTLDYLSTANQAQIDAFRTSFSIETPAKAYDAFMSAISALDSNSTQLPTLENQYANKIKISSDENGDKVYEPKVEINKEIVNLHSEIQINTGVYFFFNTKIISVLKPEVIDLNSINENTISNDENGIFVVSTMISPPTCCPQNNTNYTMYGPESKRKRITNSYWTFIEAIKVGSGEDKDGVYNVFRARLEVAGTTLHELHRHIWFTWWWEKNKVETLKQEFQIKITHPFGNFGITNPLQITDNYSENNSAYFARIWSYSANVPIKFYGSSDAFVNFLRDNLCVSKVHIKGIKASGSPQPFNEYNCP